MLALSLSPLLKSTSQKKLVDQATLPCHFSSSPDSKHDQRLDSNSLAYGATRLEICTHVFVLVLFRFVFYCASRQSVVAHVQIVSSLIDNTYCTSVQGNILLLEKERTEKKNIEKFQLCMHYRVMFHIRDRVRQQLNLSAPELRQLGAYARFKARANCSFISDKLLLKRGIRPSHSFSATFSLYSASRSGWQCDPRTLFAL